jgi:hypothetical protein
VLELGTRIARGRRGALGGGLAAQLAALLELLKRVRERRDRAQALARQQRRELRGKAAPKGATPTTGDAGAKLKHEVLAKAVRRLNTEHERRRQMAAQPD